LRKTLTTIFPDIILFYMEKIDWHKKLGSHKLVVCSGGQRGADVGGLAAARDWGLPTCGFAPKGWRTKNGPNPKLQLLGLIEHSSTEYKPRTFANVKHSDGTIRLSKDFSSPGTRCTLKAIGYYQKPYFDIDLNDELPFIFEVIDWIREHDIKVLNIAGNAGKDKHEGSAIFGQCRKYLSCVFRAFR
jgi:hypothetical protein